ncbi:Hypothetical predicted protein, partial [Olea europaea subsp. europaea]
WLQSSSPKTTISFGRHKSSLTCVATVCLDTLMEPSLPPPTITNPDAVSSTSASIEIPNPKFNS